MATIGNNRGFGGELATANDAQESQPLSALDGLTRWSVQENMFATGT